MSKLMSTLEVKKPYSDSDDDSDDDPDTNAIGEVVDSDDSSSSDSDDFKPKQKSSLQITKKEKINSSLDTAPEKSFETQLQEALPTLENLGNKLSKVQLQEHLHFCKQKQDAIVQVCIDIGKKLDEFSESSKSQSFVWKSKTYSQDLRFLNSKIARHVFWTEIVVILTKQYGPHIKTRIETRFFSSNVRFILRIPLDQILKQTSKQ